jgi:hypothetical protein
MCNGNALQQWQVDCLNDLLKLNFVEPILLIENKIQIQEKQNFLSKVFTYPYSLLLYRFHKRVHKIQKQSLAAFPEQLSDVQRIKCSAKKKGKHSEYFAISDIEKIKSFKLDFIIRFGFNIIRGEILNSATLGVWSYHHGDETKFRGGPPCFWEVYKNEKTAGAILQRLTNKLDGGIVLKKGHFEVVNHSYNDTITNVYNLSSGWIKQVCIDIKNGSAYYFTNKESITAAPIYTFPRNGVMFLNWFKKIGRKLKFHFDSLFKPEDWRVGIIKTENKYEIAENLSKKITWYEKPSRNGYYADGFMIKEGEKNYLLVEDYSYKVSKGKISFIDLSSNKTSTLIEDDFHLSYPSAFIFNNKTFVLPEAADSGAITLYEVELETAQIIKRHNLLSNIRAYDPTLLHYNNKWWLFCTQKETHSNTCLHIYYSEDLYGPYKPHNNNPVKTDIGSARPAGSFFKLNDKIVRPSQNCSKTYGGSVVLNKMHVLNEIEFIEEKTDEIFPFEKTKFNKGVHTLNTQVGLLVIDAKRYRFKLANFRKQLAKRLKLSK